MTEIPLIVTLNNQFTLPYLTLPYQRKVILGRVSVQLPIFLDRMVASPERLHPLQKILDPPTCIYCLTI